MVITLHPSQAETVTGNSVANSGVDTEAIALFVNVTAVSGTSPTLVVKLQEGVDGTNWADIPSFATGSLTTTGLTRVAVPTVGLKLADKIRAVWTIGGTTPSFTFTVELAAENLGQIGR
jgi:hypothetical protein